MKSARFYLAGAALLALSGCGGGSGSSSPALSDSTPALSRAQEQLNNIASGEIAAGSPALSAALAAFQTALAQNPNSPEAAFGAAISLAGLLSADDDSLELPPNPPIIVTGGDLERPPLPPQTGKSVTKANAAQPGAPNPNSLLALPASVPPAPSGASAPQPLPPPRALGLIWNLNSGVSNPDLLLHMLGPVTDFRNGYLPFFPGQNTAQNVARRQKLLADLTTVSQQLEKVEAVSSFTYTLPKTGTSGTARVIGVPEVYLFDAYVQSLRAKVALSLAYIREGSTAQPLRPDAPPAPNTIGTPATTANNSAHVPTYSLLDSNKDGKLTPGEYLPPSPFLTLRAGGYLPTAQAALLAVVDKETKGIAGVLARPASNTTFLVSNTPSLHSLLTQIQNGIVPLVQQAATGPVTLQAPYLVRAGTVSTTSGTAGTVAPAFATESVTVNLAAWFTHPPQDLKAFAPTYTLTASGAIKSGATTYPDSTFGGLFPKGLPAHSAL